MRERRPVRVRRQADRAPARPRPAYGLRAGSDGVSMITQTGLAEEPHIEVLRFVGGPIMSLPNLWNRVLRGRTSSRRRQQTHRQPARLWRSFVPRLEALEDRTV